MNFPSSELHSFWDISAQQPDTFSALADDDFLAFLQKQFPTAVGPNAPLSFDNPDGVDPQTISSFPPLNNSPPSSDSSPSPPSTHHESSLSRRQSGAFSNPPSANGSDQHERPQEDSTLKRKAAKDDDDDDDDEPQAKSQHTSGSNKKGGSNSSRRKSGTPQDETRLLKRKEQNRAAQRAFRERKERHVKDLEDKVAALEAKNSMSEQENENLRDLLQRLQNENMMLKQAAFTFTAPRQNNVANGTSTAQSSMNNHNMQFNFASPGAGPSKSPQPAQAHQFDLNFNSLIPFDPNTLNPAEDFPDMDNMNVDSFPFAGTYKTIASNPMFTSFAEPSPADSPPLLVNNSHQFTPGSFDSFTEHWTPPEGSQDALEQLFGASFLSSNANSVADFQAILASSPSSISPISHASLRTPSLSSAGSSPAGTAPSPHTGNGSPALHNMTDCPKTKEGLAKAVIDGGHANGGAACEMPFAPILKKSVDESGAGPFVTCKGSSFPKTEKSDKNVEVLAAWRSITSNPQFKVAHARLWAQDVDINDLCSEFTSKARCDGTKVVLEPEGVHHIIETLAARHAQAQAQQQQK
ncbi:uncharacterized protein TRAVEDRAFT_111498 [Trametes versicolor FP-101664 SS1]|uniref:uncharacterized protein n=1 Tax=Trametes versicolor (strain FP-101664) TaxID=717944 RepID=UPI0004623613|nr:uncharacterized protein TRAVEDRAFT_111498 [Trametes versicolor FP-101664 SS1]EIW65222.1 hypothetical protein TRAVEDRAFT_111498 [Trametes versicolor FP-101664 SS1]